MQYVVEITETLQRCVEVVADSESEAEAKVRQMYRSGEFGLDASDHVDTVVSCVR